ncbi:MAG: hypothetical protein VX642_10070 [Bdellovibrionota bacterium]|nr:hypothetical protein [Bdellovibrionota bacterium]
MKIHKGKTILAAILFAASYLYSKSDHVEISPSLEQHKAQTQRVKKDLDTNKQNNIVNKKTKKRKEPKEALKEFSQNEVKNAIHLAGKDILNINASTFHQNLDLLSEAEILDFTQSSKAFMQKLARKKCRDFSCVSREEDSRFKRILNYHLEIAGIRGIFSSELAKMALEQSLNLKLDRSAQELALDYLNASLGTSESIEYLADYHPSDIESMALRNFLKENKDSLDSNSLDTYSFLFEVNAFSKDKYSANTFAKSLNQIQDLEKKLPELSQKFCAKMKELDSKDRKDYVSSYYIGLRKAGLGRNQVPEC